MIKNWEFGFGLVISYFTLKRSVKILKEWVFEWFALVF